ncbi:AAA family ATPase [Xanthomonas oryzae pv. oryzae]|nr:AAA family ATPase [Xanthomonas oryzae pv. oryzae]
MPWTLRPRLRSKERRSRLKRLRRSLKRSRRRSSSRLRPTRKIQEAAITGAWKAHSDFNEPPFRDLLSGWHSDRKKFFEQLDKYAVADDVELDGLDRLQERLADATSTETAQGKVSVDLSGLAVIESNPIWAERIVVSSASRLAPLIEKWGNSDWVGQGRDIPHGNDCPFCQQKLPEKFAEDLAKLLDGDRQARVDQVKLLAERYEATVGQIKVSVAQTFKHTFCPERCSPVSGLGTAAGTAQGEQCFDEIQGRQASRAV